MDRRDLMKAIALATGVVIASNAPAVAGPKHNEPTAQSQHSGKGGSHGNSGNHNGWGNGHGHDDHGNGHGNGHGDDDDDHGGGHHCY